jgi:hypothetical protein
VNAKYDPKIVRLELVSQIPKRPITKIGRLKIHTLSLVKIFELSVNLTTKSIAPVENHHKNTAASIAMKIEPPISMQAPYL